LNRAREYHAELLKKEAANLTPDGKPRVNTKRTSVPSPEKFSSIEKMALHYLQTNDTTGPITDEYSDDDGDTDDIVEDIVRGTLSYYTLIHLTLLHFSTPTVLDM
jgi:hypothetical protein